MDRPTCKTCPYWDIDDPRVDCPPETKGMNWTQHRQWAEDNGHTITGECRRFPRFTDGTDGNEFSASWPRVDDHDWCGEHPDFPAWIASRGKS